MEESKGGNPAPEETLNQGTQEEQAEGSLNQAKDTVKYASYRDAVGRAKKYHDRYEATLQELETERQKRLEAEGNKDELIDSLRKENVDLKDKYKGAVGSFARSKAFDAITDEAVKLGVTSTRLLKRAVEDKLADLEYGEDFNPDRDQIRALLQELKNEEPILFSKEAPRLSSHQVNPGVDSAKRPSKVKDLKDDDLVNLWEKLEHRR